MDQLYFGIWKLVLMLPLSIRVLLEILIIVGIIALIWPVLKYVFIFIAKLLQLMNKCILGGIRYLLCRFAKSSTNIHEWDEKIGERGRKIDDWLASKEITYKKRKFKDILKINSIVIAFGIIYIAAILPEFKLERLITESYLEEIYFVNKMFCNMESKLTEGIENYPDLFKKPERKEEEKQKETINDDEEEEQALVCLVLGEGTSYANIRKSAALDGERLCTVSKEDRIVYQNIYEYDNERYWLKVTVESQNAMEGWISSKVIDEEVLRMLNLP